MRQTGTLSVLGGAFVASCLILVCPLVTPVWAQATNEDPLAGVDVTLVDLNDDDQANQVLVPLTDCTIAADASVTVRSVDGGGQPGSSVELVNGQDDVQIQQEQTEIVIDRADQGNLDAALTGGVGEVVESTGFTCQDDTGTNTQRTNNDAGGDEPDDQQYGDERAEVIIKTVPDKPLPKTGGFPVLFGAGLMLVAATVLGSRVIGRR
jgi:hypothetical protein